MTRQLYTCHATLTVIALLLVGLARAATTIHVPADQPTIQAAISAAQNGDTILVSPGTYAENIDFIGKAITVKSTNGAKVTIIDAHLVGPAATFKSGEIRSSVLSGFTLTNGVGSGPPYFIYGGGVGIFYASPTITHNTITNNLDSGINSRFGSPVITYNLITGNKSSMGGGIAIGGATVASFPPVVSYNTITNNSTYPYYFGGGISLNAAGKVIITNNQITQNQAPYGYGGGVYIANLFIATLCTVQLLRLCNRMTLGLRAELGLKEAARPAQTAMYRQTRFSSARPSRTTVSKQVHLPSTWVRMRHLASQVKTSLGIPES